MNAEFKRVKETFLAAVERETPAERDAYLGEACGGDEPFRRQVEALLRKHEQSGSFLEIPAGSPLTTVVEQPVSEIPGAVIGPYKLLEHIGEGGFGVVFLAEQQQPVRRKVALKILKPGMDTREVVARFEAERQALAIMDHPHIAKVFDGGATPSGRPYFVMELVKGVPITEFCDQNCLPPRQRLELFVSVCQAVQHAHQKGIIHRDLKPSNVLVSRHDTAPMVKVIDFGVAKSLGQELTDRTLFTGIAQMIGTPQYMSPEQAGLSDLDIDTRSDIYSLGVLLYELLTGTTPFTRERFKQAAYDEIRRIVREEEPPRPSTRLSGSKDALPSISAQRQTEPAKLMKLVRGELDWIVMKALEKDRNRRYETAVGLATDLQRYLNDEAVVACPPSTLYRLRKLARRHKGPLAAAALVASCLFVLACGALVYAIQQRDLAIGRTMLARDTEQARQEADAARVDAETALYRALLGRAAAVRAARNPGYRREVWDYLHQAAALQIPGGNPAGIRDEVLACLGDPIGLDPIDFPVVERMPPVVIPAGFQTIINEARAGERRIATAVSADRRWLAIGVGHRQEITLWDAEGQMAGRKSSELGHVNALAFSRDGRVLAVGCEEGTVVLSVPDLQMQTFFRGVPLYRSPAIDPAGRQLATFDLGHKIEIWSLRSNRLIAAMMSPGGIDAIEYSADGSLLLGIAVDGATVVKAWPLNATPEKRTLLGHQAAVMGIAFSPDGRLLATSSKDFMVRIWDGRTGALLHNCAGHRGGVQAVKFSPDGQWLCSVGWDGAVIVWDATTGAQLAAASVPTDLWDVDFDSSGRLLAAVGTRRLDCWEITMTSQGLTLDHMRTVPLPNRGVDLALQPGGSAVAILLQNPMSLWLCDVTSDEAPQQLDAPAFVGWYTLHFDRSGERLFFHSRGGTLGVWNIRQARATYMQTPVPHYFHAFTADSHLLAAPDQHPYQVRVFDVHSDRELFVLPQGQHNKTESLGWSPDGSQLAVGGNDGDLAIWNLAEVAACLREFGIDSEHAGDDTSLVAAQQRPKESAP